MQLHVRQLSITADEDSPYYQCEVELSTANDYARFPRDTPFTVQLFEQTYAFVVDRRALSRQLDDQGNPEATVTISGLSPLCRFAKPRATPITKTWERAIFASAVVTELIGAVTWTLVDWQIPAFRLAAEAADPLELAQQVVAAAGGLIESQPDGTVVVRPRWPVSIAQLGSATPAGTLEETVIFNASEQPTQDELMNRIRILDHYADGRDQLEYVPTALSAERDDPWNGTLYAFPSPWRSGLSLATTRGAKVQLGALQEGVRLIEDANEDYPAELVTFENGQGSTHYPIQSLLAVEWLDVSLGGLAFAPHTTALAASAGGAYGGYSLAKISYTTRYLAAAVQCDPDTEAVEAQCLLLEVR